MDPKPVLSVLISLVGQKILSLLVFVGPVGATILNLGRLDTKSTIINAKRMKNWKIGVNNF